MLLWLGGSLTGVLVTSESQLTRQLPELSYDGFVNRTLARLPGTEWRSTGLSVRLPAAATTFTEAPRSAIMDWVRLGGDPVASGPRG
jgi:hypothetical protein